MLSFIRYRTHRSLWALILLGLLLVPAVSVSAVESGGIGGRPANPRSDNPRTESIFIFTLDPGRNSDDAIRLNNNTSVQKTIAVYPVDSQASSGGAFACAQAADEKHGVGTWIKLQKDQTTLEPLKDDVVPFTIEVPAGTASGEYNGCIVIQEANQTPTNAGNGIALSFRSAIRVAVTVPGDLKKGLVFTKLDSSRTEDNKRTVAVSLKNQGNVSLDSDVEVTIRTLLGMSVRTVGGSFPVLANNQSDFNFDTTDPFWGGFYVLSAKASYNPDPQTGIGTGEKTADATTKKLIFTKPKPLALAIETVTFLLVCAGIALLVRRRMLKRSARKKWDSYTVKDAEHIKHIADKHDIHWKKLARANKLRAPYMLHRGEAVKVPPPKHKPKQKR